MPKGKKGFSSGAENHRYRHGALGRQSAATTGDAAAATCTHAPTPGEHGALGGQSAAGAGAAACDVGAGADACFQRRCLGLAAPMHAPVVLRVSAFNVAAFNQNMCMRSGMRKDRKSVV